MKKHIKASLILLIIFSLTMPFLAGCQDAAEERTPIEIDPSRDTETGDPLMHSLPELYFDGYEFRIHTLPANRWPWINTLLVVEEDSGEILESAVFNRNKRVEELLGIRLSVVPHPDQGAIAQRHRNSVNAAV